MTNFEDQDDRKNRKKPLDNKKYQKQDVSEEQYAQSKRKKQFKLKKNELRAQELWDDWESDDNISR